MITFYKKQLLFFLLLSSSSVFAGGDLVANLNALKDSLTGLAAALTGTTKGGGGTDIGGGGTGGDTSGGGGTSTVVWAYSTFTEWEADCAGLPSYKAIDLTSTDFTVRKPTNLTQPEFGLVLDTFISATDRAWAQKDLWLDQSNVWKTTDNSFQPLVQKIVCSADESVIFHGGMYGDIQSFNAFVRDLIYKGYIQEDFTIPADKKIRIVFLGNNFSDGFYDVEVLYLLLRLKIANPDKVYFVQSGVTSIDANEKKFGPNAVGVLVKAEQALRRSPVALFIGVNNDYIQCCKGGLEVGYMPDPLCSSATAQFDKIVKLDRQAGIAGLPWTATTKVFSTVNPTTFSDIGFITNTFTVADSSAPVGATLDQLVTMIPTITGTSISFSKIVTEALLKKALTGGKTLRGVFVSGGYEPSGTSTPFSKLALANGPSKGVAKLWNTAGTSTLWNCIVCNFLPSPNTPYGVNTSGLSGLLGFGYPGYTFDTYALLKLGDTFDNWSLDVVNIESK